jgi:hypothetical protein
MNNFRFSIEQRNHATRKRRATNPLALSVDSVSHKYDLVHFSPLRQESKPHLNSKAKHTLHRSLIGASLSTYKYSATFDPVKPFFLKK